MSMPGEARAGATSRRLRLSRRSPSWRSRCSRRCSPGCTTSRWSGPTSYQVQAEANRVRTVQVPAPRGRILDRNGKVIVDNRVAVVVAVDRERASTSCRRSARTTCSSGSRGDLTADGHPISPDEIRRAGRPTSATAATPRCRWPSTCPRSLKIYLEERAADYPAVVVERTAAAGLPLRAAGGPHPRLRRARSTTTSWRPGRGRDRQAVHAQRRDRQERASSRPTSPGCGARRASGASRSTPRATRSASSASARRGRATTWCCRIDVDLQALAEQKVAAGPGRRPGPAQPRRQPQRRHHRARPSCWTPTTARSWPWRRTRPTTPTCSSTASATSRVGGPSTTRPTARRSTTGRSRASGRRARPTSCSWATPR